MDLRQAIDLLKKEELIDFIETEVDPYLEISHITDLVNKSNGKALFFKKVKGSKMPILMNLFGNGRLRLFFGVDDYNELGDKLEKIFNIGKDKSLLFSMDIIKSLTSFREKKTHRHRWKKIETDLNQLPALFSWPKDGGYFYNLALTHTYDARKKSRNVGLYRVQRLSSNELILHWQIHKDGAEDYDSLKKDDEKHTVYLTFSSPIHLTYAATAPLPKEIDEYDFAGLLRGSPLKTVQLDDQIPIRVAEESEIVIKGTISKGEEALEGPYGDHTGYYTPQEKFPICKVEEIWTLDSPIMLSTVVGKPPCEDIEFGKATERIFLSVIKRIVPEIIDYDLPTAGIFHNCLLVKIKKRYPKQANKIIYHLMGLGMLSLTKLIVVFDQDCNIHDYYEAAWYALGNVDYRRDVVILDGPVDHLDHASYQQFYGGKMGVDATRKSEREGYTREGGYPEQANYSEEILSRVKSRLEEYNLSSKLKF
jgi:4-hydroxy-3-polyprenylbenzoate decarboxylase